MQKKGLGKGLSALLSDLEDGPGEPNLVEVERITPNPFQPRRSFDDSKLRELAASIREEGLIQPLLVRRKANGYELIAGERRLRAAIKAGLNEVPVVVREASDSKTLQLALIENLQREDLNPMDEAQAYQRLQQEFRLSQEEIAARVGKSRPAVANSLRLLSLPNETQLEVSHGRLAAGQARALLGLERASLIIAAAREAIAQGLSTREVEKLVKKLKRNRQRKSEPNRDPNIASMTEALQRCLGTKVRIIHREKSGNGRLEIDYYSPTDLNRITQKLMGSDT